MPASLHHIIPLIRFLGSAYIIGLLTSSILRKCARLMLLCFKRTLSSSQYSLFYVSFNNINHMMLDFWILEIWDFLFNFKNNLGFLRMKAKFQDF